MKKIMALAMALMLVLSLCTAAYAEETVTLKVDATKYLNNQNPGKQKFSFMVWELSTEQLAPVATLPDGLEGNYWDYTKEQVALFADHLRNILGSLPYTIVHNNDKTVPFINKNYPANPEIFWDKMFIIAEVHESGTPFTYDDSIYLLRASLRFERKPDNGGSGGEVPPTPSPTPSPTPDSSDKVIEENATTPRPIPGGLEGIYDEIESPVLPLNPIPSAPPLEGTIELTPVFSIDILCISPESGTISERSIEDISEENPANYFVFKNYGEPEKLPATGDSTNFVLLAVMAVAGMIGMTVIIRRKNEA